MKPALALVLLYLTVGTAFASHTLTQRDAKIRTFRALLAITEVRPDAADATHAAVTVSACRRIPGGWACRGSLSPVAFSGIGGSTCLYTVYVHRTRTRVVDGPC